MEVGPRARRRATMQSEEGPQEGRKVRISGLPTERGPAPGGGVQVNLMNAYIINPCARWRARARDRSSPCDAGRPHRVNRESGTGGLCARGRGARGTEADPTMPYGPNPSCVAIQTCTHTHTHTRQGGIFVRGATGAADVTTPGLHVALCRSTMLMSSRLGPTGPSAWAPTLALWTTILSIAC